MRTSIVFLPRRRLPSQSLAFVFLSLFAAWADAESPLDQIVRIEAEPTSFQITGGQQRLQIVVTGLLPDNVLTDVTHDVAYTVADPRLLAVSSSGRATPLADGKTAVMIRLGKHQSSVAIEITGQQSHEPVSFDHHTLPALAKAGCSGGSCHAVLHGKAGFQLSLFASDPSLDRVALVRQSRGRRVNMFEPDESLLLQKPTMRLPHQGGRRLHKDSELYRLLRDWIGEGCDVVPEAVHCVGIEVFPSTARVLNYPANKQQFRVDAHFSDGSVRDMTHLAKFDVSDESVAHVTPAGQAVGVNRGEAAIIIRYLEFIQTPLLTFVRDIDGFAWNDPPSFNYIDEKVGEKLRQLQYLTSEMCGEEVFVRRVYLDVIGLLPTPEEANRFLQDQAKDKRAKLIDELLERPEYARFWAQKWGDLLRVSRKLLGPKSVYKYNRWLQAAVSSDMPYDAFARELLTASGSTLTRPAGNYYRAAGDANDAMETTAQLFLGTRIQCAKCHNHPFERWTQDNYYGMAAFFSRIRRKPTGLPEEILLWSADSGEVNNPRNGQPARPWAPVQGELEVAPQADRRDAFADWLTAEDNPFFARVEVNRLWAQLMGRGIVEPVDDFRDSNPPANSPLLDALAEDFVNSGYSRKHILRTILNSRTYQTSSRPNDFNRDDTKYFSHYQPRRLSAEQLVDALGRVTGSPRQFELVALGTKATWLPAPDLKPRERAKIGEVEFLKVFGQPERQSVCQCERGGDTSLGQALELLNGKFVHDMLTDGKTAFRQAVAAGQPHRDIVIDLYRRALSRPPSDSELTSSLAYLDSQSDKQLAMEDVCWAIVNKHEFLFQH